MRDSVVDSGDEYMDDPAFDRGEYIFAGETYEPVYDEPPYFYDDPVEMGFYDDDPNPYHGDYPEM